MVAKINKDASKEEFGLQMAPMIDVTFQLLIFFLCTLKFRTLEGKLGAYLPKDVGVNTSPAEPLEKVEVQIHLVKEGVKRAEWDSGVEYIPEEHGRAFQYVGREVEFTLGPNKTSNLATLRTMLEKQVNVNRKPDGTARPCAIDPRKGVLYEEVVRVLDTAKEVGFTEITFIGSYEKD